MLTLTDIDTFNDYVNFNGCTEEYHGLICWYYDKNENVVALADNANDKYWIGE